MNLASIFSKLGLPTDISQDVTLLLVVVFVSFLFGMFVGRYRLITVLINIYITLALLYSVPEKYLENYSAQLIFFSSLLIVLTFLGKKLFDISISGAGSGFMWRVFVMSFLEVMLIISIALSILPKKEALGYVSSKAFLYLASPNAQFIWLAIPLIFIFVIHKKLNR